MSATTSPSTSTGEPHGPVALHDAVIRFAGDSGDGMHTKQHNQIRLRQGEPVVFGPHGERAVVADPDGSMRIVPTAEAGDRVVVHDATREDPTTAFALARLAPSPTGPTPIGIFRAVEVRVYDDMVRDPVARARAAEPANLRALLEGGNVWDVA
jgi:2-oxoglutarate ferredoxin oxidoreductase subunit beta